MEGDKEEPAILDLLQLLSMQREQVRPSSLQEEKNKVLTLLLRHRIEWQVG